MVMASEWSMPSVEFLLISISSSPICNTEKVNLQSSNNKVKKDGTAMARKQKTWNHIFE